jgi:predicted GNAT family N-acyltransferase
MTGLEIVRADTPEQLEHALTIRRAVFVGEQGVSEAQEIDGLDDEALHLIALADARPVGTLRIRFLEDRRIAKIERVAVVRSARGRQVGQALMVAALDHAEASGATEARLHAQITVQDFYGRLGFSAVGPEFDEDGIRHIAMRRPLGDAALRALG